MGMEDMPWGAEELVMTSEMEFGGELGTLALRKVAIDRDEMTAYHFHRHRNELVYVEEGLLEIRLEDDYIELEEGETFFIEADEMHQLQNIDNQVVRLLEIGFPFDTEDVVMVKDPYEDHR
ncbi:MAG: cupin domain-containing protein [Candidatus Nanohaloarchaeota archaeon QJJ-7]|nr:cupin domain-containing protein [Candidatus Nanohaloarchaeota archaeon QJJ-7]